MNPFVTFILSVAGIALIDIVLSGDNALVIGAAASRLSPGRRMLAIVWGGIAAIVFRILLTIGATEVLRIPLLQSIGAVALMFIACHMLLPDSSSTDVAKRASESIVPAIVTILIADATMSIDNILAIGALAHGNILLVIIGLLISMVLLFIASALIAQLIERIPLLLDLAALVIAYTAATLALSDPLVNRYVPLNRYSLAVEAGCVAFVLLFDMAVRLWLARRAATSTAVPSAVTSAPTTREVDSEAPKAEETFVPIPPADATIPSEPVPETD